MGIRTFKVAVFLKIRMKSECFGERIATPVCALARNDSFFDSLRAGFRRLPISCSEIKVDKRIIGALHQERHCDNKNRHQPQHIKRI